MRYYQFEEKHLFLIINLVLILNITPGLLYSQIESVWVLGDGYKVFRDDLQHPGKKKNYSWDGTKIQMSGLYNEVLALQVIVESGTQGAGKVEVAVDGLTNKSGKTIGGNTLKYGPSEYY
jgi:hypothetical protein